MKNEVLFAESQKFRQWWLKIILLGVNIFLLYGVYIQILSKRQFGNRPMNNEVLLFTTVLVILLTILFFNSRLKTQIKEDGIYVRFFPFQLSFKKYTWDKISKLFIREYEFDEFGGWGLRFGLSGNGKAFILSGDKGLQIEFTNGKKLLIGTTKPEDLIKVLSGVGQLKQ